MSLSIFELQADLQDLENLLQYTQRQRTQDLIRADIERVRILIEREYASTPQPVEKSATAMEEEKQPTPQSIENFQTITKYSFDQEGKLVKVYLSLDNIGSLDPANIIFDVTKDSFDLKILNYKNTNLRLGFKRLHANVDPSKSKFVQKTNTLIIRLQKEKDGHWPQLAYKEAAFKPDKMDKADKTSDPSASLMDMMKNLYQSGDDEMKKTISQAWQKSQDQKDGTGLPSNFM